MIETEALGAGDCLHYEVSLHIEKRLEDLHDPLEFDQAFNNMCQVIYQMMKDDNPATELAYLRVLLRHLGVDWTEDHARQILARRVQ